MAVSGLFKVKYSGVMVYEYKVSGSPGVTVMRRAHDNFVNATHILICAGHDKSSRTRILEREVQTGPHEKVQGGYGKYQGTWVDFARARELADQYHVTERIAPIFDLTATPQKAISTTRMGLRKTSSRAASQTDSTSFLHRQQGQWQLAPRDMSEYDEASENDLSESGQTRSASVSSSSVRHETKRYQVVGHKRRRSESDEHQNGIRNTEYSQALLDFFMSSNDAAIPSFLHSKPPDLDLNSPIDDEGHCALHWASAIGHMQIFNILLNQGAKPSQGNDEGETPLMRAVMFANNLDIGTFNELLAGLGATIPQRDHQQQTVFHHLANCAVKPTAHYAIQYYFLRLIAHLRKTQTPEQITSLLDMQDIRGETALNIAARGGAESFCHDLLEAGASRNHENAFDILEGQSQIVHDQIHLVDSNGAPKSSPPNVLFDNRNFFADTFIQPPPPLHFTETAIEAVRNTAPLVEAKLRELAEAYDAELKAKKRAIDTANGLLADVKKELEITNTRIAMLQIRNGMSFDMDQELQQVESAVEAQKQLFTEKLQRCQASELATIIHEELSPEIGEKITNSVEELKEHFLAIARERDSLVHLVAEKAAPQTLNSPCWKYRRLISLSSGAPFDQVDDLVGPMGQSVLENQTFTALNSHL